MTLELDTDLANQVAQGVRNGEWPVRCLVRLGVPQETAQEWVRLGEEHAHEHMDDVYVDLWRKVDVAESDCEKDWLDRAREAAAAGTRTAAFTGWMTLLERRFPDRYCVRGNQNQRKKGSEPESLEEMVARLTGGDS